MELQKRCFSKLRPKAEALGFNRKELMGVADTIAGNLSLKEDASDEEIDAAIDDAIDAVIPILKVGQSMSSRVINAAKEDKKDNDKDDEGDKKVQDPEPSKKKEVEDVKTPSWVSDLLSKVDSLSNQVVALQGEKLAGTRKSRLKELLADSGSFGARTLKNFDRMSFKDDEEFEDFFTEVESDLAEYKQELADNGLSHLGKPAIPTKQSSQKVDLVTDDQIKKMSEIL